MDQHWSRSLAGRVSFLWAAGFVVLAAAHAGAALIAPDAPQVAHLTEALGRRAAVACVFLLAYFALEQARRGPYRTLLGRLHAGGSVLGGALVFLGGNLVQLHLAREGLETFARGAFLNLLGLGFFLVSQVFFVAALLDALRREPDPR